MSAARAMDHVFGYTLENDMSDRGGRGDARYGSDWLVSREAMAVLESALGVEEE